MSADPKDETAEDGHYDDAPGARTDMVQGSNQTRDEYFAGLLEKWGDEISSMLPSTVSRQKFTNSAIAAVKNNPGIVEATPRSIYTALVQSASDGLLPDGKEGVITAYKNKRTGKKEAKWNPMTAGLRKRARELDGILIDAQIVHEKDVYKRTQGDHPSIVHEPADHLPDRGPMTLAYAIFKREDGTILHREVMNRKQIMDVKEQSSAPDGLLWTKFEGEGWRKTVIRRGIKTVPVSEKLMQVVTRDDDQFSFDQVEEPKVITPPPAPPPAPKLENKPGVTLDAAPQKKPEPVPVATQQQEELRNVSAPDQTFGAAEAYKEFLADCYKELEECLNEAAVDEIRDRVKADLKVEDFSDWLAACAEKAGKLFSGKKKK